MIGNKVFPNKLSSAYTMERLQLPPTMQIPHHACSWLAKQSSIFPITAGNRTQRKIPSEVTQRYTIVTCRSQSTINRRDG